MPKTPKKTPSADLQSVKIRQDLVLENLHHIKAAAARIMRQYPWCKSEVTLTDLEQEGALGAMQAAAHFKLNSSNSFWSFAWRRVEGRMMDMFQDRNYDHVLTSQGSLPDVEVQRARYLEDPKSMVPYEAIETASSHRAVLQVLHTLADRNQEILQQYFFDDRSRTEIAKATGLKKSQVYFWHHHSLEATRQGLESSGMNAAAFFTKGSKQNALCQ